VSRLGIPVLSTRLALGFAVCIAFFASQPAFAQSGLRVPERGEPGLDPSFARGWLAPDYDRFGFAYYSPNQWRDAGAYAPYSRMHWSYSFERGSLGMSVINGLYIEQDRQVSLFGRYLFSPAWAFSAEMSRDTTGLRPPDFRIGVQRRF
jgi:hypothetical protein